MPRIRFLLRLLICILATFGLGSILVFYSLPAIIAVREQTPWFYFAGIGLFLGSEVTLIDMWVITLRDFRRSRERMAAGEPPSIEAVSEDVPEI